MRLIYCAPESQLNWLDMPHIPNFLTFEMIVTSKNKLVLHEYLCAVFWQYIVLAKSVSSFAGGFIAVWTSVCNQHGCFHSAVRVHVVFSAIHYRTLDTAGLPLHVLVFHKWRIF